MTYYLPSPAPATIEVLDSSGRRVRCLDAPGDAGVHRVSWDLTETAPVAWLRARDWNQGSSGPTVLPGHYTVVLHTLRQAQGDSRPVRGATVVKQPLDVRADPRAAWTQAQYLARYQFVKALDDELSEIDVALNRLDRLALRAQDDTGRDAARVRSMFTSGVVNSEDDLLMPDGLRERLTILAGVVALSQGPPLPPHQREATAIHAQFENAMAAYRVFLAAHNLPPDSKQEACG